MFGEVGGQIGIGLGYRWMDERGFGRERRGAVGFRGAEESLRNFTLN